MSNSSAPTAAIPRMPSAARPGWRERLRAANASAFIDASMSPTEERPGRRDDGQDAERNRQHDGSQRDERRDSDEHQRGIVPPLKKPVDAALKRDAEHDAEEGARHRDDDAFGEHVKQDAAPAEPDEAQDANRLAPFVHEHQHEREKKDAAGDDGHDRDREVKALEHDEWRRPPVIAGRGADDESRDAAGQVACEIPCVRRIAERHVDGVHRLLRQRVGRIRRHLDQIGQMQPHFVIDRTEPHRVGHRLVLAGDAEPAGLRPGGVARQRNDLPDRQTLRFAELARNKNGRHIVRLGRGLHLTRKKRTEATTTVETRWPTSNSGQRRPAPDEDTIGAIIATPLNAS